MRRSIPALSISGWILALAVFGLQPFPAEAETLRLTPSLLLEERYDSNVFNTTINEASDFVTRANPRLGIGVSSFQTFLVLRGSLEAEKYIDHTELDSNSAVKSLELLTEGGPMRISPRFTVTPYAKYLEARDTFRRNELTLVPSDVAIPPESIAAAREKVREYTATIQTVTQLTPRYDLGIGGGWTKREFPEDTAGLEGSQSITGNASLMVRTSPRFTYGAYADTVYTSYNRNPNSRIYTAGLSGIYDWTAFTKLEARAGASYLRQGTGVGDETDTEWSPNARLAVTYVKQNFRAQAAGDYGYSGGGSFGRPTRRTNVSVSFTNQFVSRWWWDLSGYYQIVRSLDEQVTEDLATASGTAGIRYQAASWASIRLSGNAYEQTSHSPASDSVRRQSVMLGFDLSTTYPIY